MVQHGDPENIERIEYLSHPGHLHTLRISPFSVTEPKRGWRALQRGTLRFTTSGFVSPCAKRIGGGDCAGNRDTRSRSMTDG